MTESEAKTKWCPLVRLVTFDDVGGMISGLNRGMIKSTDEPAHPKSANCIASACMFWCENSPAEPAKPLRLAIEARGFCGVAGRPWTY